MRKRLAALTELQLLFRQGFPETLVQPRLTPHRAEATLGLLAAVGDQPRHGGLAARDDHLLAPPGSASRVAGGVARWATPLVRAIRCQAVAVVRGNVVASLVEHFRAMARNNAWANFRLHTACAGLSEDDYRARRTSFFPSIELTLNHILLVDWYYLDALDNDGRRWNEIYALDDVPCATFGELRREQAAADRRLIWYCDALEDDRLDAVAILNRPGDARYPEHVADVLAHLFQHDIHHRGQVHAMLAGTDIPPPQLDEFFLAQDAHLRADELRALGLGGP